MIPPRPKVEIWGGIECTINRVGDRFFRQLEADGRGHRPEDLERVAALGIRTLRFPVLWEQFEPDEGAAIDWSWADVRMERLRELGVTPIVGLVHHGSGPRFTSLVDPRFPERLARYARAVAERYPWASAFTPVNEPLTTARFSGLYGYWYPHGRDPRTFVRALLGEIRATVLAMRAIREVNPAATLVQTEDIGEIFSTPALRYQADFENERRWLSIDLLTGRIDAAHPLWGYLAEAGMTEAERELFAAEPCAPDILGLNHYITSDRYLDEDLSRYPPECHGGNGRQAYADTEAVRARPEGVPPTETLLRRAWERFGLPLAVTEAHLTCTREEQIRWFMEIWEDAGALADAGVDVRAVTAWSLFGAHDWDSLLTSCAGHYEPGVFDLRAEPPRATALAALLGQLAARGDYEHPVLSAPGWWRRSIRLSPPVASPAERDSRAKLRKAVMPHATTSRGHHRHAHGSHAMMLITGASGRLGQACARLCYLRGLPYRLIARDEMDITDPRAVRQVLRTFRPWAVVNAAGTADVEAAERQPAANLLANATGAAVLAAECARRGAAFVTFSSDDVFDGAAAEPRTERETVRPTGVHGRNKAVAETLVSEVHPSALLVRTAALFGSWDGTNFVAATRRRLGLGIPFALPGDEWLSPAYMPDVLHAALDLLIDGESGVWHLANTGEISRAEWGREIARRDGLDPGLIVAEPASPRRRGRRSLATERGYPLADFHDALDRYFAAVPRDALTVGAL